MSRAHTVDHGGIDYAADIREIADGMGCCQAFVHQRLTGSIRRLWREQVRPPGRRELAHRQLGDTERRAGIFETLTDQGVDLREAARRAQLPSPHDIVLR